MTAAALSRHELLKLIRESGLLTSKQVDKFSTKCTSEDPNVILGHLLSCGLITAYQGKELYAGRSKGFFIGKYKVLRPLAQGGMGVVLHCEHVHMKHPVAIKLLPRELNDDHMAVTRFYREAQAVAAVKHPNIVQAFDVGMQDTWHCMVMEYVDGVNLHKLVTNFGLLSEVRAAHYVAQAAAGLQCIMTSGLVHRDLKPGNLVLDRQNIIKILDLGLARFMDQRADDLTRSMNYEHVLGTADFISPEQALHSHEVDIRADIYSLGMTFYFLLTGKMPFSVSTLAGKLMAHQNRMPKPLLTRRPDISPALDVIITKMIQKKPEDRFTTPQEIVQALEPWTRVPLPMPEPEWFIETSKSSSALSSSSVKSTQEGESPATTLAVTGSRPTTVISGQSSFPDEVDADDPLSVLQSASMFSLSQASKERSARPKSRKEQWRQYLLVTAIALPLVILLAISFWIFISRAR